MKDNFFQLWQMITAASEPSLEREVGRQGAVEASAGLSGRRGEEEEVDVEHRSQEEALEVEVVLSEQEAQVDLREKQGHDLRLSDGLSSVKQEKKCGLDVKSNKYWFTSHK